MTLLISLTQNQGAMLIAEHPVFSMFNAPHYYNAMLPWHSAIVLLMLSACIYFLCQVSMWRANALSPGIAKAGATLGAHDNLIQGVQGLMLSLQATASQLPDEWQGRAQIETLLDQADKLLAQGRQAMKDAQSPTLSDLELSLVELARNLTDSSHVSFCMRISGRGKPAAKATHKVFYQLVHAAMINAALHANSRRVEVDICYTWDTLSICIRDDGKGFWAPDIDAVSEHGYPGLQQMLLQAITLPARLELWSAPEMGTELFLRLNSEPQSDQLAVSCFFQVCRLLQLLYLP